MVGRTDNVLCWHLLCSFSCPCLRLYCRKAIALYEVGSVCLGDAMSWKGISNNEVKQKEILLTQLFICIYFYIVKGKKRRLLKYHYIVCYLFGLITQVIQLFHEKCSVNTALKFEIIKYSGSTLRHKSYLSTYLHLVLIVLSLYNTKMMKYKLEIHTKAYSYFSGWVLSRYSFLTFICTLYSLRVIYFKTTTISKDVWPRQSK